MTSGTRPGLTFGIYPGSAVGDTGTGGPPDRPDRISPVIDVIAAAGALNITGYTHHTLRDARSAGSGIFCQFGLMTDDYIPKAAFHRYQDLIATFG